MIRKLSLAGLALIAASAAAPADPQAAAAADAEARKVRAALQRIQEGPPVAGPLRRIDLTESEINAYIAWRIGSGRDDVLRDLRVRLFPDNRLEGWMELDFSRHRIPSWMKKKMNLYFRGALAVADRRVRLTFEKLFLEKEPLPVFALDAIVFVASELGKTDAKSVNDWHPLPRGIKDARLGRGLLSLFY